MKKNLILAPVAHRKKIKVVCVQVQSFEMSECKSIEMGFDDKYDGH